MRPPSIDAISQISTLNMYEYESDYKVTTILLVILFAGIFALLGEQIGRFFGMMWGLILEAINGFLILFTLIKDI